jgi:photosystem II stability/assembly factor-like uncharacterized protein
MLVNINANSQTPYLNLLSNPAVTHPDQNYELTSLGVHERFDSIAATLPAGTAVPGTKSFGRWENFWHGRSGKPNVQPGGDLTVANEFTGMLLDGTISSCNSSPTNLNWTLVGPNSSTATDMGVVFSLAVHPSNTNIIYAGTQSSGLWKTTDKGVNWQCISDGIRVPAMGVSSIIIDPADAQHILFASGAHGHGTKTSYGFGIFESLNGGTTWQQILVNTTDPNTRDNFISKITFHPNNNNIVYAVSMDKVHILERQGNGTWNISSSTQDFFTNVSYKRVSSMANYLADLEVCVKNGVTHIYVSSNFSTKWSVKSHSVLWHSADNGATWTTLSLPGNSSFPDDDCVILSLDISPQWPDVLFAERVNSTNGSKNINLYKTNDNGASWTPIINFDCSEYNAAGNHVLHVSNYDPNIIYVGEDILYKITAVSNNPTKIDASVYDPSSTITHADVRDIVELNVNAKNYLFMAHDGGVSLSETSITNSAIWGTLATWKNINGTGLAIGQFIGFDYFPSTGYVFGGKQDNYAQLQTGPNSWLIKGAGDGNMVRINKVNESVAYSGYNQTSLILMNAPSFGNQFFGYPDMTYFQFSPQKLDPSDESQLWNAQSNLYRFNANTSTWTPSIRTPLVGKVGAFAVDALNNNIIYLTEFDPKWSSPVNSGVFLKSTDRGATWQDLSSNLVVNGNYLYSGKAATDIITDPHKPNRLYMSFNEFDGSSTTNPAKGNLRVIVSYDAGNTWQDMSKGFPPFPVNRLIYQQGTDEVIFAGTDLGVYRWNKASQSWECYNQNLPLAIITDLQIDYCRNKILCSTWGRGIWEAPLQDATAIYEITQSTTWGTNTFHSFATDVKIKSGVTLTINGKVSFAAGKKLIVESGAKLNVDGGLLYNVCGDRWNGIIVEGDPNKDQLPISNQGYVNLKDATIQNAANGISTFAQNKLNANQWSGNWGKTGGGIIRAVNTRFTDNGRHVELMRYLRPKDLNDLTYFNNCAFEVNGSVDITTSGFNGYGTMVTAWGVKGVAFTACTFKNVNGSVSADKPNIDRGTGILTYDAIIIVNGTIDANCNIVKRGSFFDLSKGINSYFSPSFTRAGQISKQVFAQTDRGLWVENGIGLTAYHNIFDVYVPSQYYNRANSSFAADVDRSTGIAGIYTLGTAAYHFESNSFEYSGKDDVLNTTKFLGAAVLGNSQANGGGGKFRRNSIKVLPTGTQMQLDNASTAITCNSYSNSNYALRLNPERNGNAPYFGECVAPTTFNYQSKLLDFNNTFIGNKIYDGEHKPFAPIAPANLKTYVVKYDEPYRPSIGNTNIDFNNCANLGSNLLVTNKDGGCPLTEQFEDICVFPAWPKGGLGKATFLEKRQGKRAAIDLISSGIEGDLLLQAQSDLRLFTFETDQARADFFWGCNINSLNDSTLNYNDSIMWFLQGETDIESIKMMIATLYYKQQYAAAQQYLTTITPDMMVDNETIQFVNFYTLLLNVNAQGRNVYTLNEEEWPTIRAIALTGTTAASSARGILTLVKGEYMLPYIERTEDAGSASIVKTGVTEKTNFKNASQLTLYPNPTDKSITIMVNAAIDPANAKVKVIDITGRVVLEKRLYQINGKIELSTANLVEGTYMIQLYTNNTLLEKKKLIIVHH